MTDDTDDTRARPDGPGATRSAPGAGQAVSAHAGDAPSRDYSHKPWYNDKDEALETAARFFGYCSWNDAVECGGTHGSKIAEKLAETLRDFSANATDRVFDAELRTDAADDMVNALQNAIDDHFAPENERLRNALASLERAAAAVYKAGARTGPQWLPLGASLASARAVICAARIGSAASNFQRERAKLRRRMVDSERVAHLIESLEIAPIIKQRLIDGLTELHRDSDRSGEAGETRSGSTEGESAGRTAASPNGGPHDH